MKDAAEKAKAETEGEVALDVMSCRRVACTYYNMNETPASAEWKNGSNVRSATKAEAAANKADEAARKRREKAELLKGKSTFDYERTADD